MRFRKKVVEVEAVPVSEILTATHGQAWVSSAILSGEVRVYEEVVVVNTINGRVTGHLDDWVVKGVKGELYPIRTDILDATYERVSE